MASIDPLLSIADDAQWEFSLVFENLPDEDLWRRAHPKLLSVGELAGHVAFWESAMAAGLWGGGIPEPGDIPIKSPLISKAFGYYTSVSDNPTSLEMGTEAVVAELKRVHEEAKALMKQTANDTDQKAPNSDKITWGMMLQYLGFHIAYHCGQAYSVRHLLGHQTTDN